VHEYLDYATWRLAPRSREHEEFVREVMEAWRADGGEPDVGRELPLWLEDLGFQTRLLNPIIDVVSPASFVWQWPKAFVQSGLRRLTDLGRISPARAGEIARAFEASEAAPQALMTTPALLEIIAVRR
jgi:predicted  nucleic acid-binding Zn ribbon protein